MHPSLFFIEKILKYWDYCCFHLVCIAYLHSQLRLCSSQHTDLQQGRTLHFPSRKQRFGLHSDPQSRPLLLTQTRRWYERKYRRNIHAMEVVFPSSLLFTLRSCHVSCVSDNVKPHLPAPPGGMKGCHGNILQPYVCLWQGSLNLPVLSLFPQLLTPLFVHPFKYPLPSLFVPHPRRPNYLQHPSSGYGDIIYILSSHINHSLFMALSFMHFPVKHFLYSLFFHLHILTFHPCLGYPIPSFSVQVLTPLDANKRFEVVPCRTKKT